MDVRMMILKEINKVNKENEEELYDLDKIQKRLDTLPK